MTNPNIHPHQPEFVDNRDENILAAALIARIEHLCATLATAPEAAASRSGRRCERRRRRMAVVPE